MSTLYRVKSWKELVRFLQRLAPIDMACRGQDQNYGGSIRSRFDRCLELSRTDLTAYLRAERAVSQRFREHAPIYLSEVERRYLKSHWVQLIVMQHYGVPTRLVDWTKSPWVAAFFAVSSGWDSDGCIYGFRRDRLESILKTRFTSDVEDLVWGPHPSHDRFSDDVWDTADANTCLFFPKKVNSLASWLQPTIVASHISRD